MTQQEEYKHWLKVLEKADESLKRQLAGAKALDMGWGGISKVATITGMSSTTIRKGISEIDKLVIFEQPKRIRKSGGGRKRIEIKDPKVIDDLEAILDENTAGDNMSLLKWTTKSTYTISKKLKMLGYKTSPNNVGRLLKEMGYSLQANVKNIEGGTGLERDKQFKYINKQVNKFIKKGNPIISVDAKKRENIGNFKNQGKTWEKKGKPKEVNVYDFITLGLGIAIPYGTYDVARNEGFVNVGISHDTSEFAVESIYQWWDLLGKINYPNAKELLICADGGGSNGSRRKGWKYYLQELSNQIKTPITVSHLPPGTSKWNKIEHRMFSFISKNWKGTPLVDYQTIINLISNTTTNKGLIVVARLDEKEYETGRKFSDEDIEKVNLKTGRLFPKWNYTIKPIL